MDNSVFLVIVFVIVASAAWPMVRHVSTWKRPRAGRLEDVELGLARVRLPVGWRPARDLNDGASLQALDPLRNRYLIVISEPLENFERFDLAQHSAQTIGLLTADLTVLSCGAAQDWMLGSCSARQVEIEAVADNTVVTYLHTTIRGVHSVHQVIAWAVRSHYSRQVFERLLEGFEELPGPAPRPVHPAAPLLGPDAPAGPPPRGSGRRIGF